MWDASVVLRGFTCCAAMPALKAVSLFALPCIQGAHHLGRGGEWLEGAELPYIQNNLEKKKKKQSIKLCAVSETWDLSPTLPV